MSKGALIAFFSRLAARTILLAALCLGGIGWVVSQDQTAKPAAAANAAPFGITKATAGSMLQLEFDALEPGFYYPEYRTLQPLGSEWIPMLNHEQFYRQDHYVIYIQIPDGVTGPIMVRMVRSENEVRPTIFPQARTQCPVNPTTCPQQSTLCYQVVTECPAEPVVTQCPVAPTQCMLTQTVCPNQPTVCPDSAHGMQRR